MLKCIGETDFWALTELTPLSGEYFIGSSIEGNSDIRFDLGSSVAEIFGTTVPFSHLDKLSLLGITNNAIELLSALKQEIHTIYNAK
jgi:hypothetical protein